MKLGDFYNPLIPVYDDERQMGDDTWFIKVPAIAGVAWWEARHLLHGIPESHRRLIEHAMQNISAFRDLQAPTLNIVNEPPFTPPPHRYKSRHKEISTQEGKEQSCTQIRWRCAYKIMSNFLLLFLNDL